MRRYTTRLGDTVWVRVEAGWECITVETDGSGPDLGYTLELAPEPGKLEALERYNARQRRSR